MEIGTCNPDEEVYYRGIRLSKSGPQKVRRIGDGKITFLDPAPSQTLWNHSPDGFQWGYGGSGPAQLALAILLDATGDSEKAVQWHQSFKTQFVSRWEDEWTMTRSKVLEWVKTQGEKLNERNIED